MTGQDAFHVCGYGSTLVHDYMSLCSINVKNLFLREEVARYMLQTAHRSLKPFLITLSMIHTYSAPDKWGNILALNHRDRFAH